ncbi:MAG: pyridoxamine 5'-phosphate oxidase family protein [Anaerolineae bacterium]|nr:pyridoxamine 5'-phosphate oxidase family protein [Anaerolineae bacterium]
MARDYLNQPLNAMRRDDRGVDDEAWIGQFLQYAAVGTLALSYEGQPFVNTNLFVYDADAHCIYTHTARVGRTRAVIEANPRACFSVMEMGRMLPAPEALEFSVEYAGVTCFGTVSVVEDQGAATQALQLLLDKYAPHLHAGDDYRPPVPEELVRTTVFRLDIDSWSGKKKEVEEDFAGAFWYPEQPILTSVRTRSSNP